jgi:16S rRNA (adenine1518-N6/adenine1519-N6)-dimethyltransferase
MGANVAGSIALTTQSLLAELALLGIRPRKGLGQNFLVDPSHRARIVAAAELTRADTVLEIGPGPGVLTELLTVQAGRVVAVELDDRLIPFLRDRFAAQTHVTFVHADILAIDVGALMAEHAPGSYKVVANLPYYITGAVIPHVLEATPPPTLAVVTVQREVAERMCARPPEMSLLALGVQFYAIPQIVDLIPAGAFYPIPKVDSSVVRLVRRTEPAVPGVEAAQFFRVARAGFSQRRKQLRNSLAGGLRVEPAQAAEWLAAADLDPRRRAETLTLEEWGNLARVIGPASPPQ